MKHFTNAKGAPRSFFSPTTVAKSLGVHKHTVLRLIKSGKLTAYSVAGGSLRIPEDEIEKFLQERTLRT